MWTRLNVFSEWMIVETLTCCDCVANLDSLCSAACSSLLPVSALTCDFCSLWAALHLCADIISAFGEEEYVTETNRFTRIFTVCRVSDPTGCADVRRTTWCSGKLETLELKLSPERDTSGTSLTLEQTSSWTHDELFRFWWSKISVTSQNMFLAAKWRLNNTSIIYQYADLDFHRKETLTYFMWRVSVS